MSFPISLRALFGVDKIQNAVHGSSTKERAQELIKEFFGESETSQTEGKREGEIVMFSNNMYICEHITTTQFVTSNTPKYERFTKFNQQFTEVHMYPFSTYTGQTDGTTDE